MQGFPIGQDQRRHAHTCLHRRLDEKRLSLEGLAAAGLNGPAAPGEAPDAAEHRDGFLDGDRALSRHVNAAAGAAFHRHNKCARKRWSCVFQAIRGHPLTPLDCAVVVHRQVALRTRLNQGGHDCSNLAHLPAVASEPHILLGVREPLKEMLSFFIVDERQVSAALFAPSLSADETVPEIHKLVTGAGEGPLVVRAAGGNLRLDRGARQTDECRQHPQVPLRAVPLLVLMEVRWEGGSG
ncbi:hypothetical protein EYF80_035080 [Liparis tanakae]|uniref:Uncharacterized protein n=1 Tax=Liparis tanakae TaxID=230148 RepID=A0A4Z2GM91_9TELE|nr:hypothetical protein EYF80_035080 [Liparis tanakae]